ncbi:hypothetical protein F2Q69_00014638 [Brassica cretica]|uniref:Uncharacterized protein n=1 Tax=Brassica cretica TaxID=69181 RepID=A0A8S9QZN2_BRACR|nr:hypothetical protein F2Q69_00014638 [Brassica cretica]
MAKSLCIVTLLMIFLLIISQGYRMEKLNARESEAKQHLKISAILRMDISAENVTMRTEK